MRLKSPLHEVLGIEHPLLLAPMAGVAGGALAAAVSAAGGLGFIGGGYGDATWLAREWQACGGSRAVGIGFITWRLARAPELLDAALAHGPRALWLSFGDAAPFVAPIRAAGCRLVLQVQSVRQARAARDLGADVIVAQGGEAGGHGGQRSTLPLVPAVVDAVAPLPVVAAGGIADGRGIAAAFCLGAAGVALGSRFYTCPEALSHPAARAAAVAASGDDTTRSPVFDRLRGYGDWPPDYALRTLANTTTASWADAPGSATLAALAPDFAAAVASGDVRRAPVIVGEAVDLVDAAEPAGALVRRLVEDAAAVLAERAASCIDRSFRR